MNRYLKILIPAGIAFTLIFLLSRTQRGFYGAGPAAAASAGVNIQAIPESSGSVAIDWSQGPYARVQATGSPAAGIAAGNWTLSNPVDGATYTLEIDQGVSGVPVVLASAITAPNPLVAAPTISATATKVTILQMIYNAAASKYIIINTNTAIN